MTVPAEPRSPGIAGFRTKLLLAMMLVVSAVTAAGLFLAQRNVAANAKRELEQEFHGELASLHAVQDVRHAALAERCRTLARKPRLHAALEDNALDLLYPSARDELSDVMEGAGGLATDSPADAFHATFYRFLDASGAVIAPPAENDVGPLSPAEESRLAMASVPARPQVGYLSRQVAGKDQTVDEIIALPITSTETGAVIAALVLGFKPFELGRAQSGAGIQSGIWLDGALHLPALDGSAAAALAGRLARALATPVGAEGDLAVQVNGMPCLLFYKLINPGSVYAPADEVCVYPLADSLARQRRLRWQFAGAGILLMLGGLAASNFLSARLSVPVVKLAVDSEENRAQRARAEAALGLTSEELQRSARFSADASHQLKTPVTVLRAGLEELLAGETVSAEMRADLSALIHQTFRLTSVIEDLLLLSRMDAGRLQIDFRSIDLKPLIDAWIDDLGALPDYADLAVETEVPPALLVAGEERYLTLILQNLLENARKYNRPGGRIRLAARSEGGWAVLTVGNTGPPIPRQAQLHIFERFHRGTAGEDIPGHGLGLNLARELARLHHGELRLTRSDEGWTEFEVRFRLAGGASATVSAIA